VLSVRKSIFQSFLSKYAQLLVHFVSTVFIARLLTPQEIGIFSVSVAIIAFAYVLRNMGVGQYVIQEKELTDDRIRAAFAISLSTSWVLGGVVYFLSNMFAVFYETPGIEVVMQIIALNFLLIPFGSITHSVLQREMRFDSLLRIELGSALVHASIAVGLAFAGWGYISLAWASVAGTIASIIITQVYRPKRLPYLPGFKEVKHVMGFGAYATGSSLVRAGGQSAPELILGKALGMAEVGIFSRATSTINLFYKLVLESLNQVFLPYFAEEHRQGREIKTAYLHTMACVTALAWPFFMFLGFNAEHVVLLLYGNQWGAAVPIIQILVFSSAFAMITAFLEQLLTATGHIKKVLKLSVIFVSLRVITIMLAGSYGLEAVAYALYLTVIIRMAVVFHQLRSVYEIKIIDHFELLIKGLGLTIACLLGVWGVEMLLIEKVHYTVYLTGSALVCGIVWLLCVKAIKHPVWEEVKKLGNIYKGK